MSTAITQAAGEMELSEPAIAHLRPDMSALSAVQALLAADQVPDALKLAARLLPKRYAVAWMCQCARDQALSPEDKAGLSLAEAWVRDPGEGNRRAAFEFANAGEYQSIGAWLAAAAGWSGGSLAPAEQEQAVPPAEHLTARAVVAALNLMAGLVAEEFVERRRAFIARAATLLNSGQMADHA